MSTKYMNITEEQRDEAYQNAAERTKKLYSRPESGRALRAVFTEYNLPDTAYSPYVRAVGDMILGLLTKGELPSVLEQEASVPPKLAPLIAEDVFERLDALSFDESDAFEAVVSPDSKAALPGENSEEQPVSEEQEAAQPLTREELLAENQPEPRTEGGAVEAEEEPAARSHQEKEVAAEDGGTQENTGATEQEAFVPRYARPFTETPRYGDDTERNPQQ